MNSAKTYPYPVLGNSDDIEGEFTVEINPEIDQDDAIIFVNFTLAHPTIEKLIADGVASFGVDVSCKKTMFKQSVRTDDPTLRISIDSRHLRDRVEVSCYVVSNIDIKEYDPHGVHKDMDFGPIDIDSRDILADGGTAWFIADKYFDPLKAPVSSFIKVFQGTDEDGVYTATYDNNEIRVWIPKLQFSDYSYINKVKNGALVHSSIVLPVLVEAIILSRNPDFEEFTWATKLKMMIEKKNLDIQTPFPTAQELLGLPIKRGVNTTRKLISEPSS